MISRPQIRKYALGLTAVVLVVFATVGLLWRRPSGELLIQPSSITVSRESPNDGTKSFHITIDNQQDHNIELVKVDSSCSCTATAAPLGIIKSGATVQIPIEVHLPAFGDRSSIVQLSLRDLSTGAVIRHAFPIQMHGGAGQFPRIMSIPANLDAAVEVTFSENGPRMVGILRRRLPAHCSPKILLISRDSLIEGRDNVVLIRSASESLLDSCTVASDVDWIKIQSDRSDAHTVRLKVTITTEDVPSGASATKDAIVATFNGESRFTVNIPVVIN